MGLCFSMFLYNKHVLRSYYVQSTVLWLGSKGERMQVPKQKRDFQGRASTLVSFLSIWNGWKQGGVHEVSGLDKISPKWSFLLCNYLWQPFVNEILQTHIQARGKQNLWLPSLGICIITCHRGSLSTFKVWAPINHTTILWLLSQKPQVINLQVFSTSPTSVDINMIFQSQLMGEGSA